MLAGGSIANSTGVKLTNQPPMYIDNAACNVERMSIHYTGGARASRVCIQGTNPQS